MNIEQAFNKAWYGKSKWTYLFYPILPFVRHHTEKKRQQFLVQQQSKKFPLPIIVIGNITVGGTGKSPMVIALVSLLQQQGLKVGIVSRGYGADIKEASLVDSTSSPYLYGDEPVMLAQKTQAPLAVSPRRTEAVELLLAKHTLDVIVSDDGMQHYALDRDIEILMLDMERGIGNGELLPVGPLRESAKRAGEVDFIASVIPQTINDVEEKRQHLLEQVFQPASENITKMKAHTFIFPLFADTLINVKTGEKQPVTWLSSIEEWQVVAGIGNPERFLTTLKNNGLTNYQCHWFADHHTFTEHDFSNDAYIIMTEKDAVKCRELNIANPNLWYLSISLDLPSAFSKAFLQRLDQVKQQKHLS